MCPEYGSQIKVQKTYENCTSQKSKITQTKDEEEDVAESNRKLLRAESVLSVVGAVQKFLRKAYQSGT